MYPTEISLRCASRGCFNCKSLSNFELKKAGKDHLYTIVVFRAEDIVTEDAKVRKSQPDKPIHRYNSIHIMMSVISI